jgi:dolichol kinase
MLGSTLALGFGATHVVLRTTRREVRYGVPVGLVFTAALTGAMLLDPALMIRGLDQNITKYENYEFGSFPSHERVMDLGQRGYTVVSLVHPAILPFEQRLLDIERGWAEEAGVPFISIPMMPWISQNEQAIADLQRLAVEGEGRYYVHCWFGYDRTLSARQIIINAIAPGAEVEPPADYGPNLVRFAAPDIRLTVLLTPPLLFVIGLFGATAGWLHRQRRWAVADTRKAYHVAIFTLAAVLHVTLGIQAVQLFAVSMASALAYIIYRGKGFAPYDSMSRAVTRRDSRAMVVLPVASTAIGGLVISVVFYELAAVGYLVVGWADAAGEIFGRRWGKRGFTLNLAIGGAAHRTLVGSSAVAVFAFLAASLGIMWDVEATSFGEAIVAAIAVALVVPLVEAFSGGGIDNATIPIAAAAVAWIVLAV